MEAVPVEAAGAPAMMPMWIDDDFKRGITFGDIPVIGKNRSVFLQDKRKDTGGKWHAMTWRYSVAYTVVELASRGQDTCYLSGIAADGATVVEEWLIMPDPDPLPGGQMSTTPPTAVRSELYRGHGLLGVIDVEADPEGRFLLFIQGQSASIKRLALTPDHALSDVALPCPSPPSPWARMYVMQHVTLGRCWVLESLSTDWRTLVIDSDNDAVFDLCHTLDHAAWTGMDLDGACWTDDFVDHAKYR